MSKKVLFEPNICVGCEECVRACARWHEGETNAYVEQMGIYNIPMRCMHCADAPCVAICPVKAISINKDGVVLVDKSKCIGCGSCLLVCPFGIPRIDTSAKIMRKCDLCIDRVKDGMEPACVQFCSVGALKFVDPEEVEKKRRERAALKLNDLQNQANIVREVK
ncbi:MAG: 4Fe-4S dicluster domain-containing protein [Thermoanaerobacteraceae bacterium]|nr:4Fe-4S dicluster domain-containing protein [Thermoanaerobacteraceae bacterium]